MHFYTDKGRFGTAWMRVISILGAVVLLTPWVLGNAVADENKQSDWQKAKMISKNDYTSPGIVASAQEGRATAVWTQSDGLPQEYGVWVNQYHDGRGWGKPQRINDYTGQADEVAVAVNRHGDAIVVWIEYSLFDINNPTPLTTSIWYSRSEGDKEWSKPEQLAGGDVFPIFPQVAMDDEGNVVVVWQQTNMQLDISNIYGKTFTRETGWSDATLIQADDTISSNTPKVAMNHDGQAAVVWGQIHINDNFYSDIGVNRYDAKSGWVGGQSIPDTINGSIAKPAIDEHADVMVVFQRYNDSTYQDELYAARYTPGHDWEAVQYLQDGTPDTSINSFDMAGNDDGETFVIWKQTTYSYFGDFTYGVHVNHYQPGSGWDVPQLVGMESFNYQDQMHPKIGVDKQGNAVAVWDQENPDAVIDPYAPVPNNIYAFQYTQGNGWDAGQAIQKTTENSYNAQLSVNGAGEAYAIWIEQDNTTGVSGLWANQKINHKGD